MSSFGSTPMSNKNAIRRKKSIANDSFYFNKTFTSTMKNYLTGGRISMKKVNRKQSKAKRNRLVSQTSKLKKPDVNSICIKKNSLFNNERWMNFDDSFQGWNMITDLVCNTEGFHFKNIMNKISMKKPKIKYTEKTTASINPKRLKSSYGKPKGVSLNNGLSEMILSPHPINNETGNTSLIPIEENIEKLPIPIKPMRRKHTHRSKAMSMRRNHEVRLHRPQRRHKAKETATQVFNKIIDDINAKKSLRNRTIEPRIRSGPRDVMSSQGPRNRMKLLELGSPKMILTPERQMDQISIGRNLEEYKETVISQMRECQSPIQVLKMSKVLCAPFFSYNSPTQKSVTKYLSPVR
ncbi:unnamed protein product [Moneuplotes crassus]|uniref:Uncharacterized protein n=1 Tax=Euplotes crassus TaxID=5936 RepID=A0AAD1XAB1_EUPCR|nr:unnamed protein product [Moneuplotes crassus]